jgi:hypothetical protein
LREAKSGQLGMHRSVDELDLRSFLHHLGERPSVPIGEADATVRFRLADVLRVWRAMDPVAIAEIDPGTATGFLGPAATVKGFCVFTPLNLSFGL